MRAAAALLTLAAAGAGAADAGGWSVALRSDRHSDGVPLAALAALEADDPLARLRPRDGRQLAYIDDELRASRQHGAWTWSLLARQSALLAIDRETLELALRAAGRTPAVADGRWDATLRYRQFSGAGVEAGRGFVLAGATRATLAAQVLVLAHWRQRHLGGPAAFDAASGTWRFDLRSQEADDRMREPFQQPFAARGLGLLLHGAVQTTAGAWRVGLAVRDLGWLHWHALPRQELVLSTATRDIDADGFVVYRPLVQGRNRQDGSTRTLGGWWTARLALTPEPGRHLELAVETTAGAGALASIAAQQRVGAAELSLRWRLHERRLTLGIDWQGLSLRLGADRPGAGAHSRELGLSYARAW